MRPRQDSHVTTLCGQAMDNITRLVESLGRNSAADEESILVLLAVHGRKAVDPLMTAASSPDSGRRAAAVTALGRIADPRGRRAIMLSLADRIPAVRAAATTALAGFPSAPAAARLHAMLARETDVEVRARAASTLVDMFMGGTVEALDTLLAIAQDRRDDRRVRLESLKVLASLPALEARAVAAGLMDDPDPRIAQAASRYAEPGGAAPDPGGEMALEELQADDYFTHRRAASLLASLGEPAIATLVRALRERACDAAACARIASVVREIARGRERILAPYLEEVEEVTPLGLLVDIVGASRDRTALYHLKGVIDRIGGAVAADAAGGGNGDAAARRMIAAKAHYALARAGSRVAYDGLRTLVARRDEPLMGETLMAVEEIGGREELLDLLGHYGREQGWMKDRLRAAFRRLMTRTRVKPDDPIFARLDDQGRALLEDLLSTPSSAAPGSSRTARRRIPFVDSP